MITPFQKFLRQKPRHPAWYALRDSQDLDRSTLYRWSKGKPYPPANKAPIIIRILAEHDVAMDYNGIYEASLPEDQE